jgi:hypothetical protein
MIQTALRALGGAGTQPEISDYIEKHFVEDIASRKTWRNSVSGVLSSNPLFVPEAIIGESGKRERKSLWRLKGYKPPQQQLQMQPPPPGQPQLLPPQHLQGALPQAYSQSILQPYPQALSQSISYQSIPYQMEAPAAAGGGLEPGLEGITTTTPSELVSVTTGLPAQHYTTTVAGVHPHMQGMTGMAEDRRDQ